MIIARDRFLCRIDKNDAGLKVAHIKPCILGGTGQPWNLFTLCQDCYMQKQRAGWTIPGPYAAQLEYSYENYLGHLWDFLTPRQQHALADEAQDWFGHRVVM
ncbi:HNH endonuclease [Streptomyces sp. NPDC057686]|uniref:HNH endonuclease n=1 Tax=Streptomyces sp. NPDC057686 TaxID=3346212 RepID=UPI0036952EDD